MCWGSCDLVTLFLILFYVTPLRQIESVLERAIMLGAFTILVCLRPGSDQLWEGRFYVLILLSGVLVGLDESWYVLRAPNSDYSDVSGLSVQFDPVPYHCLPVGTPPSDTPKQLWPELQLEPPKAPAIASK